LIYLDSSAIIKLIRPEVHSLELAQWLASHGDKILITSAFAEIEVPRALRRTDHVRLAGVPTVLAKLNKVEIDSVVRITAAAFEDPHLRSLDAIHLATAHSLIAEGKSLKAFVTYDKRLFEAAGSSGLQTVMP
jgi:predicted nucleic acid-binding protein